MRTFMQNTENVVSIVTQSVFRFLVKGIFELSYE